MLGSLINVGIAGTVADDLAEGCGIISHVRIWTAVDTGTNWIDSVSVIEAVHFWVGLAGGCTSLSERFGKGRGWACANTHRLVVSKQA